MITHHHYISPPFVFSTHFSLQGESQDLKSGDAKPGVISGGVHPTMDVTMLLMNLMW